MSDLVCCKNCGLWYNDNLDNVCVRCANPENGGRLSMAIAALVGGPVGRLAHADALAFILAGNATFTFRNTDTGNRFTFKASTPKEKNDGRMSQVSHFVGLLSGPDNTSDYRYMGCVFNGNEFRLTRGSKMGPDAPSVKAFGWVFARLVLGTPLPGNLEIWHEGRCGKCGRELTVPESVERGIGPVCAGVTL